MGNIRKSFYKTTKWKKCRDTYYAKEHGVCERCGGLGVIVHHKIYLTDENYLDPNISLNFDNLELLCMDCHNNEHKSISDVGIGMYFNEDGDLIGN